MSMQNISLAISLISIIVSVLSWSQMKESNLFYQRQAEAAVSERTPYVTINFQASYGSKNYGIYVTNPSSSIAIIERIKVNGTDYDYITSSIWKKILQKEINLDENEIKVCFSFTEPYKNAGLAANDTMPLIFIKSFIFSSEVFENKLLPICKESLRRLNKLDIRIYYKSTLPNAELQETPQIPYVYESLEDMKSQITDEDILKLLELHK